VLVATLRGAGELKPAGRPAEEGDEIVVDFTCTIDDEEISGASATGYQAQLGDGRLLTELEEAIAGVEAGTTHDVPVTFPADHPMQQLAGREATFHVKVRDVQVIELPELTDEVAAQVSEFPTAEALLADIRGSITERLEEEVQGIFRANAVSAFAVAAELDEPAALVQGRQQELYQSLKQQLSQAGLSMEAYLDRAGRDTDSLFAELEQSAREDLRRELTLLALAEDVGIEVTEDDLRREVTEHAEHTGQDVEEAMQQVVGSGRADILRGELLIQRTIDHLVATVKPRAVDLPTPEEAAAEAAERNEEPIDA
jgi:trigger factor